METQFKSILAARRRAQRPVKLQPLHGTRKPDLPRRFAEDTFDVVVNVRHAKTYLHVVSSSKPPGPRWRQATLAKPSMWRRLLGDWWIDFGLMLFIVVNMILLHSG
ncbi:MAG: hypothetical protein EOP38_04770 [Rubrivivax sp.]|nr:MAG: hypothetical protein EOP38_04770 [Rubrivivax sp.]